MKETKTMEKAEPTMPSQKLQTVLELFEANLKEGRFKDADLPEFYVMATALMDAHASFAKAGKVPVMFDSSNPFDLAMLVWCVEAEVREKRKKEAKLATAPDPRQN